MILDWVCWECQEDMVLELQYYRRLKVRWGISRCAFVCLPGLRGGGGLYIYETQVYVHVSVLFWAIEAPPFLFAPVHHTSEYILVSDTFCKGCLER